MRKVSRRQSALFDFCSKEHVCLAYRREIEAYRARLGIDGPYYGPTAKWMQPMKNGVIPWQRAADGIFALGLSPEEYLHLLFASFKNEAYPPTAINLTCNAFVDKVETARPSLTKTFDTSFTQAVGAFAMRVQTDYQFADVAFNATDAKKFALLDGSVSPLAAAFLAMSYDYTSIFDRLKDDALEAFLRCSTTCYMRLPPDFLCALLRGSPVRVHPDIEYYIDESGCLQDGERLYS